MTPQPLRDRIKTFLDFISANISFRPKGEKNTFLMHELTLFFFNYLQDESVAQLKKI